MATVHGMTTTVAVPDGSGDGIQPFKRTYTSADYETAFHVWHGPAGHSLNKTAALTGYPLSTIHSWSERHNWNERATTLSEGSKVSAARAADDVVQSLITSGQVPAIIALHEIVSDPGHKRRDVAALALLALGGRPLPKAPTITATKTLGDGSTISVKASDLSHLDPQQLAHFARTGELPASLPGDTDSEG